jgi:3-deoxy-manno-octulosonate cytidylyltransferase (CMP-KDO synthetase)
MEKFMSSSLKVVIVIPARYKSSRFEGKPLAKILGEPMIIRVCKICAQVLDMENIYVATDDVRIKKVVKAGGFNAVMTSNAHLTGTDRIAEVASIIDADLYVNVQGDEPVIDPNDITQIIEEKIKHPNCVIKGFTKIMANEDPDNLNMVKVIFTETKKMIYMSRSKLPGIKNANCKNITYHKAVCIYAFNKKELQAYAKFGRKSDLEMIEDIEILRFLDLGIDVRLVETKSASLAVDELDDILKVEIHIMKFQ